MPVRIRHGVMQRQYIYFVCFSGVMRRKSQLKITARLGTLRQVTRGELSFIEKRYRTSTREGRRENHMCADCLPRSSYRDCEKQAINQLIKLHFMWRRGEINPIFFLSHKFSSFFEISSSLFKWRLLFSSNLYKWLGSNKIKNVINSVVQ